MSTQTKMIQQYPTAWCEIDLRALRDNVRQIKKYIDGFSKHHQLLPIIKANAYGHGIEKVLPVLQKEKISFLAVSNIDEALQLRSLKFSGDILLLESTLKEQIPLMVEHDLIPTLSTIELAHQLHHLAKKRNKKIKVHLEIDTGMSRLGIFPDDVLSFIQQFEKYSHLVLDGVFTHFPVADQNLSFTKKQMVQMQTLIKGLQEKNIPFSYVHCSASMGILRQFSPWMNLFRPGIMLYGLYPSTLLRKTIALKPVMSVKARVLLIKTIPQGSGVSYGHTWIAKKKTTLAVLGIGYSDGYLRSLSNRAKVMIKGILCPVVGRVTMDQIMVDISQLKNVHIGDVAVVLGACPKSSVSADDLAQWAGTIHYEITCHLGNRLPHRYIINKEKK